VRAALDWFAALLTLAAGLSLLALGGTGVLLLLLSALGGKAFFVAYLLMFCAGVAVCLTIARSALVPRVKQEPVEKPE
jgi:hypothetical protein